MTNKEKNFMSAVLYVHNDEAVLADFLRTVMGVLEDNFEHSEIICVNDHSQDDSAGVVREISKGAESATVTVLNMSYFHGIEAAMNAGMDLAIGDFVLEFDACVPDFEASEIMRVYRRSLEGYDIVSASPDTRQRFTSSLFYRVFNRFTDFPYQLGTERFRVLSRRVINRISSMNKTVPYRKAVYANCGLKTANIRYRATGAHGTKKDESERRYRTDLAINSMILFTGLGYHPHDAGCRRCGGVLRGSVSVQHSGGRLDNDDLFHVLCLFWAVWDPYDHHKVSADIGRPCIPAQEIQF